MLTSFGIKLPFATAACWVFIFAVAAHSSTTVPKNNSTHHVTGNTSGITLLPTTNATIERRRTVSLTINPNDDSFAGTTATTAEAATSTTKSKLNTNLTIYQSSSTTKGIGNPTTNNHATPSNTKVSIFPWKNTEPTVPTPNPTTTTTATTTVTPPRPKQCRSKCSSMTSTSTTSTSTTSGSTTSIDPCEEPPDTTPRFLFSGQSNMVGRPNHASRTLFEDIVNIASQKFQDPLPQTQGGWRQRKDEILQKLYLAIYSADDATKESSWNEADLIYDMAGTNRATSLLNPERILALHPFIVCSFTKPPKALDCERAITPTACGLNRIQYGPELMFAHHFARLDTIYKNQPFGITKVAEGGTKIDEWLPNPASIDNNALWLSLVDNIRADNGSIEAFVWFQGENDHFPQSIPMQDYLESLQTFIQAVRLEIFASHQTRWGTLGSPTSKFNTPSDIPVIIVELGAWVGNRMITNRGEAFPGSVITAQREFVARDPRAVLVPTGTHEDPTQRLSQHLHFDAASQLIIGYRIAEAFKELLER